MTHHYRWPDIGLAGRRTVSGEDTASVAVSAAPQDAASAVATRAASEW
jgi:hypothetical protein